MTAVIESYLEATGKVALINHMAGCLIDEINDTYCEDHQYELTQEQATALREAEFALKESKSRLTSALNNLREALRGPGTPQ